LADADGQRTRSGAATQGTPVNPLSRAVHPREQYPLHFDLLMRDIFHLGRAPEEWQVIAAEEVRLDEDGMDVDFTIIHVSTNQIRRRRVCVQQGRLVRILDC
jgi:hypothetical protein